MRSILRTLGVVIVINVSCFRKVVIMIRTSKIGKETPRIPTQSHRSYKLMKIRNSKKYSFSVENWNCLRTFVLTKIIYFDKFCKCTCGSVYNVEKGLWSTVLDVMWNSLQATRLPCTGHGIRVFIKLCLVSWYQFWVGGTLFHKQPTSWSKFNVTFFRFTHKTVCFFGQWHGWRSNSHSKIRTNTQCIHCFMRLWLIFSKNHFWTTKERLHSGGYLNRYQTSTAKSVCQETTLWWVAIRIQVKQVACIFFVFPLGTLHCCTSLNT